MSEEFCLVSIKTSITRLNDEGRGYGRNVEESLGVCRSSGGRRNTKIHHDKSHGLRIRRIEHHYIFELQINHRLPHVQLAIGGSPWKKGAAGCGPLSRVQGLVGRREEVPVNEA